MDKPFLHIFLLTKIRKKATSELVDGRFLKEQIGRVIVRKGGLPRFMIKYVIQDLVELGFIEHVNNNGVYRLNKIKEEKRIKMLNV